LRPLQSEHEGTLPYAAQPQQHAALSHCTGTANFRQGVAVNFAGSDAILFLFWGARAPATRIFSRRASVMDSGFCLNFHALSLPLLELFCFLFFFYQSVFVYHIYQVCAYNQSISLIQAHCFFK
jgi:hypothetical protein